MGVRDQLDRLRRSVVAGVTAFRQAYSQTDLLKPDDFISGAGRRLRYQIYWGWFEGSAFSKAQPWLEAYKVQNGLYRYTRQIYDPAARLGNFWRSFLMGGPLDPDAGDGSQVVTALPINTKNEIRKQIARVFKDSRWQVWKDVCSLHGAVLGDTVLMIEDNSDKRRVSLKVMHPGIFDTIEYDDIGNVRGYVIVEQREDPTIKNGSRKVEYMEIAARDGDEVVYETKLNKQPYDWTGQGTTWRVNYGFTPVVVIQHKHVGLDWGWNEFHDGEHLFREVDDLSSALHDQIRKAINSGWLLAGVSRPEDDAKPGARQLKRPKATMEQPQSGREEAPILYGSENAKAYPMVFPLDIAATSSEILRTLMQIEKLYPELLVNPQDFEKFSPDASGVAIEQLRDPAERKVRDTRSNYDDGVRRAVQMALSIGGIQGYEGYEGITRESFGDGALDFSIGERPVFQTGQLAKLAYEKQLWESAQAAKDAGMPLDVFLKDRLGWSEDRIKRLTDSPEWKARMKLLETMSNGSDQESDNPPLPSRNRGGSAGESDSG